MQFSRMDLETFESCAYIMAKHADASVPSTIEDWLDGFEMFDIYQVLPEILGLWGLNEQTTPMTTALFLLRCLQVGISIRDLDLLTIGMVNDMYTEQSNDDCKWEQIATQEDYDRF